jgi:glycogen(starch) synthase
LAKCKLIFTSSDQIADALAAEYGIARPLPLYNVPPIETEIPAKPDNGLALYWRNAVVGLGQRGLDEALVALTKLPADVMLHLQGRMPIDSGAALKSRIATLGLDERVIFHLPYMPDDAVEEAAKHHVGLCLERRGIRNQELTVSNKIFDYHMAGLAVVASDLPGLRSLIERSHGGLLFEPGSADDLAEKILALHNDRTLLKRYAQNARDFALREGNREREMEKFARVFQETCGW